MSSLTCREVFILPGQQMFLSKSSPSLTRRQHRRTDGGQRGGGNTGAFPGSPCMEYNNGIYAWCLHCFINAYTHYCDFLGGPVAPCMFNLTCDSHRPTVPSRSSLVGNHRRTRRVRPLGAGMAAKALVSEACETSERRRSRGLGRQRVVNWVREFQAVGVFWRIPERDWNSYLPHGWGRNGGKCRCLAVSYYMDGLCVISHCYLPVQRGFVSQQRRNGQCVTGKHNSCCLLTT